MTQGKGGGGVKEREANNSTFVVRHKKQLDTSNTFSSEENHGNFKEIESAVFLQWPVIPGNII